MVELVAELQDSDLVACIFADEERMARERANYEPIYRDIDRYIDPFGAGGFNQGTAGNRDIEDLYDVTAIDSLDRYVAAIGGLSVPQGQFWHGVTFADKDLAKLPSVKRWCEHARARLFECRYAPSTGFAVQAFEDIRQEGKYGTAPLWVDERPGVGLFYKALHLSECKFDENYYGQVDKLHRRFTYTLRQARQQFGVEALSDKVRTWLEDPKNLGKEIELLHVVRPNGEYEPGGFGVGGQRFESYYLEVDTKHVIRRKGYHEWPVPTSRHVTGPRDKYGRSPAMKVLATVKGLNVMARDLLEAGNLAVRPPLLFNDDADITTLFTKAGTATPGGIDEYGRPMVQPLMSGAQIPFGKDIADGEREIVKRAFLEEFFLLLSNPSDRMTATQVIEQMRKEGILAAPFAGRHEAEKLGPAVQRELGILMRADQIDPFPPEVLEAGARPVVEMTNPLARMRRAEEVGGWTRWVEIGVQAVSAGAEGALDRVDFDKGMAAVGEVLGVPPTLIRSDAEVAQVRANRQAEKDATAAAEVAPKVASAALDLAKANELGNQLGAGGGL